MRLFTFTIALFVVCLGSNHVGLSYQETDEKTKTSDQDKQAEQEKEKQEETVTVEVADGKMKFEAPKSWEEVEPKFSLIEAEFAMKPEKDDEKSANGRMTIMSSGGGVKANIQRWFGQFAQADGKSTEDVAEVEEVEIAGLKVHMVDISGNYKGGPGSTGELLEDYRMLAAVVETEGQADYFIKFYGPANIVEANAKRFKAFVESMKLGDDH